MKNLMEYKQKYVKTNHSVLVVTGVLKNVFLLIYIITNK